MGVADLGVSDVTTSGEVFNLKDVADFSGVYASGEAGAALDKGPIDTILKNTKGVLIPAARHAKGARLTPAAQGVNLKIKPGSVTTAWRATRPALLHSAATIAFHGGTSGRGSALLIASTCKLPVPAEAGTQWRTMNDAGFPPSRE